MLRFLTRLLVLQKRIRQREAGERLQGIGDCNTFSTDTISAASVRSTKYCITFFPFVLLPSVIVPIVLFSHLATIKQLLKEILKAKATRTV
jgi:hypothetical protein